MNDKNFGIALESLKIGLKVSRRFWQDRRFIRLDHPGNVPTIKEFDDYGNIGTWFPGHSDLLACDWFVLS